MAIDEIIQGRWCLVAEKEPYSTEGRTLLTFATAWCSMATG